MMCIRVSSVIFDTCDAYDSHICTGRLLYLLYHLLLYMLGLVTSTPLAFRPGGTQHPLLHVHDGIVAAPGAIHHLVRVHAHDQQVAQQPGLLQDGHVAAVEHVPGAVHVDHAAGLAPWERAREEAEQLGGHQELRLLGPKGQGLARKAIDR